jgi:outer membrane protein assembly factor BamA
LAIQLLGSGLEATQAGGLEFAGGTADDQAFARAAAGLRPGGELPAGGLATALEAIRATDRFRKVEADGNRVILDPWPAVASIQWRGDVPSGLRRTLFVGLRKESRMGAVRLEALRVQAEGLLQAAGYPKAQVHVTRAGGDAQVIVDVAAGPPNLILGVELVGRTGPFSAQSLLGELKVELGHTLWNREFELESLRRLRKRLVKKNRFEGRVDLDWDKGGMLRVTLDPGPKVILRKKGGGILWPTTLKDLVPLTRADRYSPELLDEGERRIVRMLRSKGHLDPQVSHTREVTKTGPDGDEEVVVTYYFAPGPVSKVGSIRFEGNRSLGVEELARAADPGGFIFDPKASPDVLDALESRVQACYERKGFTEVKVRRTLDVKEGRANVIVGIREGKQHLVSAVRLELPAGGLGDPWGMAECLALLFAEKPKIQVKDESLRLCHSDRLELTGVEGRLIRDVEKDRPVFTLRFPHPIPLQKQDYYRVYAALNQKQATLGVVRSVVRPELVEAAEGTTVIRFEVPDQPLESVNRIVVQGVDRTRARAILREIAVNPGTPLDQDRISRAQGRLGTLGAFGRIDVASMGENAAEQGPPSPWKAGDLLFRMEERSPWVFSNSLGYDRTQGYYLGQGVQRLNVGGMGRTLDFNIRAGDGTINNRTLRDLFPTGTYTRSLDSYSTSYSDPWFDPAFLGGLLPDRTGFRAEGAYIQEQRYLYDIHRRRVLSSLRWPLSPKVNFEVGYRFERVDVNSNIPGVAAKDAFDRNLENYARYPPRSTISSPYMQLVRDTRDNAFDPTTGSYTLVRFEAATQLLLSSSESRFLKLDMRNQWTWPVGYKARAGVVSFGVRFGIARPTANDNPDLPLAERFFAGGSGTMRGVEPDFLGPITLLPVLDANGNQVKQKDKAGVETGVTQRIPVGGQALALVNLEYRFPLIGQTLWGEIFLDSGQVYKRLKDAHYAEVPATDTTPAIPAFVDPATFPALRTALGIGLILKLGVPLKLEYARDIKRLLNQPRTDDEKNTQLRNVTISAGFQF